MTMERIFNKRNLIFIFLYFAALFGIRYYQTTNIKDIIETSIMLTSIPFIIIFGRKALLYCIIVFVSVVMHLDQRSIYASLCIFTISAFIKRKNLILLTIIYHVNTLTVYAFDKTNLNVNAIVFYSICIIIFVLIYNYPQINRQKLNLTDDEILILSELAKGKQLKEIDGFSKNTKTNKLKEACNRNNIMNKNELIYLFKNYDWE